MTVRFTVYPEFSGAFKGTADKAWIVAQGLPSPDCWIDKVASPEAGQGRRNSPPPGLPAQSSVAEAVASLASVRPLTACDSKRAANFSNARAPQRFAVVLNQAPRS